MFRVLVTDTLAESGLDILRAAQDVELDYRPGLKGDALLAAVAESDALITRSGTAVTPELVGAGTRLRIIGRAGVGLDNVDVEACTAQGQRWPFFHQTTAPAPVPGQLDRFAKGEAKATLVESLSRVVSRLHKKVAKTSVASRDTAVRQSGMAGRNTGRRQRFYCVALVALRHPGRLIRDVPGDSRQRRFMARLMSRLGVLNS